MSQLPPVPTDILYGGHILLTLRQRQVINAKIKSDNKYEKIATGFGINPWRKVDFIPEQPCHLNAKAIELSETVDENMLQMVRRKLAAPNRRNLIPATESQVYGWHSTPLVKFDKVQIKTRFGRKKMLIY